MGLRLSEEQARQLGIVPGARGRNKYGAARTEYRGVSYDSRAEADRARALDNMVASGEVRWWLEQPKFRLGVPENVYRADFLVVMSDGSIHVEDVKGHRSQKFNRDVRLWRSYGPCPLHIIGRSGTEVVVPKSGVGGRLDDEQEWRPVPARSG